MTLTLKEIENPHPMCMCDCCGETFEGCSTAYLIFSSEYERPILYSCYRCLKELGYLIANEIIK